MGIFKTGLFAPNRYCQIHDSLKNLTASHNTKRMKSRLYLPVLEIKSEYKVSINHFTRCHFSGLGSIPWC